MLPGLLLLGGVAGARDAMERAQNEQAAEAFRRGIGDAPGVYTGQENLMEGDPQQMSPGTGLRGAVAQDPALSGMLSLLSTMAGQPGVTPSQLLSLSGSLTSLQHGTGMQSRAFGEEWRRMEAGQNFQAGQQERQFDQQWAMRADDQDFRKWEIGVQQAFQQAQQKNQFGQAWALAQYHETMQAARAQASEARAALTAPTMPYLINTPQGVAQIVGPRPGTKDYAEGVTKTGELRAMTDTVDQLLTSYRGHNEQGREYGGLTGGQQTQLYNRLQGYIFKLRDMGAPQAVELENFWKTYPSPDAFFSKFFSSDKTMFGTMETLRKELEGRFDLQRQANPWIVTTPVGAALPPMPTAQSVGRAEMRVAPDPSRLVPYAPGQTSQGRIGGR